MKPLLGTLCAYFGLKYGSALAVYPFPDLRDSWSRLQLQTSLGALCP